MHLPVRARTLFTPRHGGAPRRAARMAHRAAAAAITVAAVGLPAAGLPAAAAGNTAPRGVIDTVTATGDSVTVSGWAFDPDTSAPIATHVYLDGHGVAVTADRSRPDVGKAFGRGDRHGYTATLPATPGKHTLCVYAINATPGPNPQLGCRTVTVADAAPVPPAPVPSSPPTPTPATPTPAAPTPVTPAPDVASTVGSATPSTGRAPLTRPLSWAPPALQSPTTVQVSASNRDLRLATDRDYVLRMPAQPLDVPGGLSVSGGRNVVLIGGEIRISTPRSDGKEMRGLYLKGQTGTVHVEGLKITGAALAEGINLDQRLGATVQLQNVRVDTVRGTQDGHHADVLQTWAGPSVLRIDGLTGYTTYQGFFLLPQQFGSQPEPAVFDFRNVNLVAHPGSGYLLWRDGSDWPIRSSDVWTSPSKQGLSRDYFLWPKTPAGRATWQDVRVGMPPAGDFVPAEAVGTRYVSPGYAPAG